MFVHIFFWLFFRQSCVCAHFVDDELSRSKTLFSSNGVTCNEKQVDAAFPKTNCCEAVESKKKVSRLLCEGGTNDAHAAEVGDSAYYFFLPLFHLQN